MMVPLIRRPPGAALRSAAWVLVLTAFLFGASGASVLFVGVWKHEASRARAADSRVQAATEVVSSTAGKLRRTQTRLDHTLAQLKSTQATVKKQSDLLGRLGAAGRPIAADAGRMDSAARQLAADGAALGDAVAKLTNAVAALGVYLKQTSPSQLDPAYVDAQLSYLEQTLGSLQARSDRLTNGAGSVAAGRKELAGRVAALEQLAAKAKG
jgi:prefoldin subunit 5